MLRSFIATIIIFSSLVFATALVMPSTAKAVTPDPCDLSSQERKINQGIDLGYCAIRDSLPNSSINNIRDFITVAVSFTAKAVGVLALLGLIVTGIMYITSGADADKAGKAQKNLGWIVTGLVIFMLLFWIPQIIRSFVNDLPKASLEAVRTDKKGTLLTTKKASTDAWPKELESTNLMELMDKRALAVADRASITINNGAISPQSLTVSEGSLVIWYNNDKISHRYKKDPSNQSTMGPESITVPARTYYLQFVEGPGEFNYVEDIPGPVTVKGTIVSTEDTQLATPSCSGTPVASDSVSIAVSLAGMSTTDLDTSPTVYNGTEVIWTNTDTKPHTITRDRRSTMKGGPKPTVLQPGQSLRHIFTGEPNIAVQFTYFDETNPSTLYGICMIPPDRQGTVTNDTL
jgi:plastocyanin